MLLLECRPGCERHGDYIASLALSRNPTPGAFPPCPLRFPPVLVSRVWARSHRSWLRQWLRSSFTAQLPHPAVKRCKSLQLQFYSRAAFPPAVKQRFTAELRPHPAVKRCKSLQPQFYSRAASPPSCKALQTLAVAVLQPSCVHTGCKTPRFYSWAASSPSGGTLRLTAHLRSHPLLAGAVASDA
jgi:hypothetical protein